MRQFMKRALAGVMSLAMAVTMLPSPVAGVAKAAASTETITCSKFVVSGAQGDSKGLTIATSLRAEENSGNGSKHYAAYVKDVTGTVNSTSPLGSTRVGGIAFTLSDTVKNLNPDLVKNATVTIEVNGTHTGNLKDGRTKAALFSVAADKYDVMVSDTAVNEETTYPAVDDDYSREATVYSDQWLTKNTATGTEVTFNVTDWVKKSIQNKDAYVIFRLQTVLTAFYVTESGDKGPRLSVTSITEQDTVEEVAQEINLPSTVRTTNLTLPTASNYGTTITWASDNSDLIATDGIINQETRKTLTQDTTVNLTATVTRGEIATNKSFPITVKKYTDDLIASYEFSDTSGTIQDVSGNSNQATLEGTGATVTDGMLTLPGGASGSGAAYVSLPGAMFENQDTITITTWLKNGTGAGDYAAMYFGTPSKHIGGGTADMPLNYWLLNPNKGGKFKSVWTNGKNAGAPYSTETPVSDTATDDQWRMYTTVITPDRIIGYYDGVEVCNNPKTVTTTDFGTGLVGFIGRSAYNDKFYQGGVYGVKVYEKALTQQEIWNEFYNNMPSEVNKDDILTPVLNEAKEALTLDVTEVSTDLELPTTAGNKGAVVTWKSSKPNIIGDDGKIGSTVSENDEEVVFTATIQVGGKTVTKEFTVTVLGASVVENVAQALSLASIVRTNNLDLPTTGSSNTTISWSSSNPDLITNNGIVNQEARKALTEDTPVILTATVTKGSATATKEITVTVKKYTEGLIAAYEFKDAALTGNKVVEDISGNGNNATLVGTGATISNGILTLPGGNDTSGAYVSLPGVMFENQDTLTITTWLKNETGAGNYAAMSFGTPTKHVIEDETAADKPLNYWILNPKETDHKGMFKSVWTDDNNANAPYSTETPVSETETDDQWRMYTTVITPDSIIGYYDGVEVCNNKKTKTTTDFGTGLVGFIGRSAYNDKFYQGGVYGVKVYEKALTEQEILDEFYNTTFNAAKAELTLGDITQVKNDLELPTTVTVGGRELEVTWSSDKPAIIANDGTVTRPTTVNENVVLTATIKISENGKEKTATKEFTVTVLAINDQNIFDEMVSTLTLTNSIVTTDLVLPNTVGEHTTVTWSSSKENVIKIETVEKEIKAIVTRPAKEAEDEKITLTAKIVYDNGTNKLEDTKTFDVIVRAEDYGYLMSYTNNKEAKSLGNSLHLAYSLDGKDYTALNSNTGICFANNAGGEKNQNPNGLKDMYIFRKADGTYGMVARNITKEKYIYVYDSVDLIDFTNERRLTLKHDVIGGLQVSQVGYNQEKVTYQICWTDGKNTYCALTNDFSTVISEKEAAYTEEEVKKTGTWPTGAAVGNIFGVNKAEYERVVKKLDVVRNIGIETIPQMKVKDGDNITSLLPKTLTADYSDGTSVEMGVTWSKGDLAKVNLKKAGTYQVTGTVNQTQYPNPFIAQRADPCILQGNDGYYYFTASYPMKGSEDKDGYDRIVLRRAKTIQDLADAEEIAIWDCDNSDSEFRYIWAPEIRLVDGNYYVFYTSSTNKDSVWTIRPHVLKCNNAKDIMNPASWEAKGLMQAKEGDTKAFSGFSLDMTVFENNGRWYVAWAQTDGFSSIFIAEVDKDEPWKCISDSVKISVPEYSWERQYENVNEGPSIIKNNGKIYMAFSASATGPEYCIGLLSIDEKADLLDASAWKKQAYPVLTSTDVPGEYGPGHNSFTVDENGNPIFVYHARGQECYDDQCGSWATGDPLYDPCRDARLKRVHWAADGTPILKMSYEEELAEENRKVTATLVVEKDEKAVAAVNTGWGKITVSPSFNLTIGNTELIAVNYPQGFVTDLSAAGLDKEVSYSSSNIKVAEVSKTGKITAKAAGTANITTKITLSDKRTKSFTTKVTVQAKPSGESGGNGGSSGTTNQEIAVKTLKLNKTKLTLELKKTYKLKATVTPSNATNKKVSWKSSDSKIVAVSNGKLTAKKVGSANIAVATSNGKIAICKVTVKIGVKKVTLNKKKVTLGVKETFTLKTTITPKNATNKKVKWTSDKKNIATVNSKGVVTAKKAGKAKITATVDGKKVSCTVTVKKAPSKITLNKKSVSLKKNKTFQIKVKFPKNTTSNKITYKSSKPKIVSVTSTGKVKALKKGSATITVQTFNKKKATLKVTVK